jgi:hypothetical protein
MHDRQQQEERPGEMRQVDAIAHRMLDEPRQSGQQPRHVRPVTMPMMIRTWMS